MGNAESCECSVPSEGGVNRFINDPWKGLGLVYYPEADDSDNEDDDIDEVLEGKLYLGGMTGAMNHKALRQRGITHVLNLANYEQAPKAFRPSQYTYLVLHAVDSPTYNLRRHFPISNRFISDALAQNGKVYVHCVAGISRAPAAVAAYLMANHRMSLTAALQKLQQCRRIVRPNAGFRQQLVDFEQELLRGVQRGPATDLFPPPYESAPPRSPAAVDAYPYAEAAPPPHAWAGRPASVQLGALGMAGPLGVGGSRLSETLPRSQTVWA